MYNKRLVTVRTLFLQKDERVHVEGERVEKEMVRLPRLHKGRQG